MDGFIHSSSHSSIHPLTPVGEVFISFKREAGEDLTFIAQLIFVFFFILSFVGPVALTAGDRPSAQFCPFETL